MKPYPSIKEDSLKEHGDALRFISRERVLDIGEWNNFVQTNTTGGYAESSIDHAHEISLVTGTPKDITSLSLPAGDWIIWGYSISDPAAGTTVTQFVSWIYTTSATLPSAFEAWPVNVQQYTVIGANGVFLQLVPMRTVLSAPTTFYLSCQANFTGSTNKAYGRISARLR